LLSLAILYERCDGRERSLLKRYWSARIVDLGLFLTHFLAMIVATVLAMARAMATSHEMIYKLGQICQSKSSLTLGEINQP